jgi:hypothetical protein
MLSRSIFSPVVVYQGDEAEWSLRCESDLCESATRKLPGQHRGGARGRMVS